MGKHPVRTFRIPDPTWWRWEQAARSLGCSVSEFVRVAVEDRIQQGDLGALSPRRAVVHVPDRPDPADCPRKHRPGVPCGRCGIR